MKKIVLLFLLIANIAKAQSKHTISGTVTDAKTGEAIIGATIRVNELENTGAHTNNYGFYSITLPDAKYTLTISNIGKEKLNKELNLQQNQVLNFALEDKSSNLKEAVIRSRKKDENVTQAVMGVARIDMKEINKLPVLFGERDILKSLQLMPGVKTAGEGNGGLYVRGGNADQNLILLDDAPVYNAYHLLGFFSTFNSDAIKDVTLYKGGAPAEYGGRLSSVIDVKMNEGNNQNYHVSGGVGLIASRINIEGPIVKNKGSFLISARRTYADQFLKLSKDSTLNDNKIYFYDINLKANYEINKNNKLYLSGYFGRDVLGFKSTFGLDWGNTTATLRWNHIINAKWFSNTSFIYSNFDYKVKISAGDLDFKVTSKIRDFNLKQEFQNYINPKNTLKIGFNVIHHTITPGQITVPAGSYINPVQLQERYGLENAIYATNEYKASNKLNINYGLRVASYSNIGAGDFYTFDADGNAVSSKHYNAGQVFNTTVNFEPRLSASYIINEESSIKGAYSRNSQNLHVISNSTASSPTDAWIGNSPSVKPEIANQLSTGYFRNFKDNEYEFSSEIYYKYMQNQLDLKNNADIRANDKLEGELLVGAGRAYGIEFLLKKKVGKLHGWLGYTLSKAERKIPGINNNTWYNAKQDETHDVSLVAIYDHSPRWSFSGSWIYNTGNAVTFPIGKYMVNGQTTYLYGDRNANRMPSTHRLDLSATWYGKKTKKFQGSWNISCYNAYGRENPYQIDFQDDPNDKTKTQAVQTSLFRWVPSITYNFKF